MNEQRPLTLRELVIDALTAGELNGLASDHFKAVYRTFSDGMDHAERALRLDDHCQRHGADAKRLLIGEVRRLNPAAVEEWERSLASTAEVSLDWPKHKRVALLSPEEIPAIVDAARAVRQEALSFCEQLDDDEWWERAPVAATHARDQRRLRGDLVSLTTQVLAAADYLLAVESADISGASGGRARASQRSPARAGGPTHELDERRIRARRAAAQPFRGALCAAVALAAGEEPPHRSGLPLRVEGAVLDDSRNADRESRAGRGWPERRGWRLDPRATLAGHVPCSTFAARRGAGI